MQLFLNFIGLVSALALSFVSSGMETALYRVSRVRMRIRAEQGEERASLVLRVLDRIDAMVTTILIDNNIAAYAGTYFLTVQLVSWKVRHSELITTAIITPLFFILTESLPKQLAYNNADRFSTELVRVFDWSRRLLSPFVWVLNKASWLLRRLLGSEVETTLSQSQRTLLMEHLNAGVAEHVLSEEQNKMAVRIMQLEGISAGDCMVPLRKLPLVPITATRERALREMARRNVEIALLVDGAGKVTHRAITMAALVMHEGPMDAPVDAIAETLQTIRFGVAVPDVLNLFRTKHALRALVLQGTRPTGLITTKSVLDTIAGIG